MTRFTLLLSPAALLLAAAAQAQVNDNCAGAISIGLGPTLFDTTAATTSAPAWPCGGGGGPDLWYTFTAPATACYSFDTCDTGNGAIDTVLEVFSGACGSTSLSCNDDTCSVRSRVDYQATVGDVILVRVGGFGGATGTGIITVTQIGGPPLANDECSGAIPITLGAPQAFDTTLACQGPPDWTCASGGGPDLWYSFTAPNNAIYTFDTCNSFYDTSLMVFDGTCGSLNSLGCNDDSCSVQSSVAVPANSGDTFLVRVGGWNSSVGQGNLEVSEIIPAQPAIAAHYRLDETSGNTCLDSSGNGNHGTYIGGVTLGQPGAAPGSGRSVAFNTVHGGVLSSFDGYVTIPGSATLDLQGDLSVSAWVNLNQLPQGMPAASGINRIFGNQGPSGGWSWGIKEDPGMRFTTHAILDYDIVTPIAATQWTHVAAVFDVLGDVTFYVNGANIGVVPGSGMSTAPGGEYHIGAWNPISPCGAFDCAEFFDGRIDDLQYYQGALTDADILFLFNNPGSEISGSGPIGMNYCGPAITNSTGFPGTISATGSNNPAANDLTLTAAGLPPGQFGYFLAGQTQGFFNPMNSSGIICLQGNIGRFNQVANIITGPSGSIGVNLTSIPVNPPQAVMPGERWNFQCWYRDVGTNNFTDGLNIQY